MPCVVARRSDPCAEHFVQVKPVVITRKGAVAQLVVVSSARLPGRVRFRSAQGSCPQVNSFGLPAKRALVWGSRESSSNRPVSPLSAGCLGWFLRPPLSPVSVIKKLFTSITSSRSQSHLGTSPPRLTSHITDHKDILKGNRQSRTRIILSPLSGSKPSSIVPFGRERAGRDPPPKKKK